MGKGRFPGRHVPPPLRILAPEEMLERLHTILYSEVGEAVKSVAHLEKGWSESEMVKRIVRYIYKAAGPEDLRELPWEEAVKKLVHNAMQSYGASCQEKAWFYDLELGPVFARAGWEMLAASRHRHSANYRSVQELAEGEYQTYLDETLHNKATWIAVEEIFPDSKIQAKVFASLQKTYQAALDMVLDDTRPLEDIQRLQNFLRKWMEDSLGRAWSAVGEPDRHLTEDIATRLFQKLMAPFGSKHPFSCVPQVLTESIGRPPNNWAFIRQQVRTLFRSWHSQAAAGGAKKKRRRTGDEEDAENDEEASGRPLVASVAARRANARGPGAQAPKAEEDDEADEAADFTGPEEQDLDQEEAPPEENEEGADFGGPEGEKGHPQCTSQEDCQGSEDDALVRHILNGNPGDVYCRTCWNSFLQQNPQLEGEEEPGP